MLCRPIHIKGTCFTYVPNPTPYRWDRRSFSLGKLMAAFRRHFNMQPPSHLPRRNHRLQKTINDHLNIIAKFETIEDGANGRDRFLYLKALREALQDVDQVLTGRTPPVNASCAIGEKADAQGAGKAATPREEADSHRKRRVMVQDVLRSHLQEVLRLLNETDERPANMIQEPLCVPEDATGRSSLQRSEQTYGSSPNFQRMNAASPDERQLKFMEVYFDVICPLVVSNAEESIRVRRYSTRLTSPPIGHELRRRSSGRSNLGSGNHLVPRDRSPVPSIAIRTMSDEHEGALRRTSVDVHPRPPVSPGADPTDNASSNDMEEDDDVQSLADEQVSHADIWCTLVFRMICWLMLHDFNKMDVQLPKSELRGSRMPVYIS